MTMAHLAPTITVTIGRQTRVYHAFITTAPASYDAPSTLTLHAASLADVSGLAADDAALPDEEVITEADEPVGAAATDDDVTLLSDHRLPAWRKGADDAAH